VELAPILNQYRDQLLADPRFQQSTTFVEQKQALWSITSCRTLACGEIKVYCPQCRQYAWFFHSCGHRSCPSCQYHETSRWLRRQIQKLLPVDYFLVTFTLPAQLRALAKTFPQTVFNLMFRAAEGALQQAAPAYPAQRLQEGQGLWVFAWKCQKNPGPDPIAVETEIERSTPAPKTGFQVPLLWETGGDHSDGRVSDTCSNEEPVTPSDRKSGIHA